MRVLLTGATGFLGSVLWRRFLEAGHEVVAIKRSGSDVGRVQDLIMSGIVIDADTMPPDSLFDEAHPSVVVHTACAYGRQGEGLQELVAANLGFGLGLLEQCARNSVPFVNTASMLEPNVSAYALSKMQFMQWLDFYTLKAPAVSLRFDHLYGPGDDSGKFVLWVLDQFSEGAKSIPLTSGEQTRDFIHIRDAASLFCLVLERLCRFRGHTVIPAGSCNETKLKDFVLLLAQTWEQETGIPLATRLNFGARPYRAGTAMRTVIAPVDVAGRPWKAAVRLEDGIREMVQWYIRTKKDAQGIYNR